ncbi:MAG TPA: lysylphosphatidylglycerol synthase domain-containing protein, partial [Anaerolineales bacterium]|nr:lysylphosphatidylglycerol synthase domain-containing protein [Anaerolineales bacterium]
MRSLRRRLLSGLVLGFLVILGLALLSDVRQVTEHLAVFSWQLTPLILACTLFNYTLRFVKWHFYLGLVGVRHLPLTESLRLFVGGFPLAVTPGKVGEALKGVWLNQLTGVPVARAVPVVVAERISDGLAVLALSTLGVIAYPRYWPAFASVLGILLTGVILTQIRPVATGLITWTERLPLVGKLAGPLREFYEGAYVLFRPLP